jgi:hypothetical protein
MSEEQRSSCPDCQQDSRSYASCDQEAWVRARIRKAIDMSIAVQRLQRVGAEEGMKEGAIRGIANACAVEVISTLNIRPSFINLRDPWKVP